jgi:hypothetical protein
MISVPSSCPKSTVQGEEIGEDHLKGVEELENVWICQFNHVDWVVLGLVLVNIVAVLSIVLNCCRR